MVVVVVVVINVGEAEDKDGVRNAVTANRDAAIPLGNELIVGVLCKRGTIIKRSTAAPVPGVPDSSLYKDACSGWSLLIVLL